MPSRKKRKRDRRRAEATAAVPVLKGDWGAESKRPRGDMLLIRKAIRGGWDVPQAVRDAIVDDVIPAALESIRPRLTLSAVRAVIEMVEADRRGSHKPA